VRFKGDTPYALVVLTPSSQTAIDLDEPGWTKTYAHLMRTPGRWILARKDTNDPVFVMTVKDGEQPYYTSRVLGSAILPPPDAVGISQDEMFDVKESAQVRAHGIGKKRLDGHVDRMWVLPTGAVCTGDDVDELGAEMAKIKLFALLRSKQNGPDDRRHRTDQEDGAEEAGDLQEDG
jgi:hypothetical protein